MEHNVLAIGFAWYVIFLFSTVVHEACHALVARWGGDDTASNQVTLDPLPHLQREPFGMVLVPWLYFFLTSANGGSGFMMGWASTPYDPMWAGRNPHKAARMALAGPVGNLILLLIGGVLLYFGIRGHWFASENGQIVGRMVQILFDLNIILMVFNLLPFPPLDGASVLMLLMPEATARKWQDIMAQPIFAVLPLLLAWQIGPLLILPALRFGHALVQ